MGNYNVISHIKSHTNETKTLSAFVRQYQMYANHLIAEMDSHNPAFHQTTAWHCFVMFLPCAW